MHDHVDEAGKKHISDVLEVVCHEFLHHFVAKAPAQSNDLQVVRLVVLTFIIGIKCKAMLHLPRARKVVNQRLDFLVESVGVYLQRCFKNIIGGLKHRHHILRVGILLGEVECHHSVVLAVGLRDVRAEIEHHLV